MFEKMILFLVFFVVLEETSGCWYYFILVDSPEIFQVIDYCCLFIQSLEDSFVCDVVQSENAITDSC